MKKIRLYSPSKKKVIDYIIKEKKKATTITRDSSKRNY